MTISSGPGPESMRFAPQRMLSWILGDIQANRFTGDATNLAALFQLAGLFQLLCSGFYSGRRSDQ